MAELVLDIDLDNIVNGIKKLDLVESAIEKGLADGLDDLAKRMELKLIQKINDYGLAESRIASTISIKTLEDGISISVGADYALFLEYGTGIVGKENPHPKKPSYWIYDKKGKGGKGWWYPTTQSDPNPKKWVDPDGTLRAWTAGQESKPFMYETWLYGSRIATQIIRKHIRINMERAIK